MTTTADGLDLAKRLRACAGFFAGDYGYGQARACAEAAAFIERSCNTGQGVGEAIVNAAYSAKVLLSDLRIGQGIHNDRFPDKKIEGPLWNKIPDVVDKLAAALAARIPEASVEQAGRSSAEPVAWTGPFKDDAAGALDSLRKSVAELLGEDANTWPDHGNAPLAIAAAMALLLRQAQDDALAPPAGRQEAVAWLHEIDEPGYDTHRLLSFSADNPWSHWLQSHRDRCQYRCTPLSPSGADLGGEVEYRKLFNECAEARDAAGFLGSVPECVAYLDDALQTAESRLATAAKALRFYRDEWQVNAEGDFSTPGLSRSWMEPTNPLLEDEGRTAREALSSITPAAGEDAT